MPERLHYSTNLEIKFRGDEAQVQVLQNRIFCTSEVKSNKREAKVFFVHLFIPGL